jgi:hypothetical protein
MAVTTRRRRRKKKRLTWWGKRRREIVAIGLGFRDAFVAVREKRWCEAWRSLPESAQLLTVLLVAFLSFDHQVHQGLESAITGNEGSCQQIDQAIDDLRKVTQAMRPYPLLRTPELDQDALAQIELLEKHPDLVTRWFGARGKEINKTVEAILKERDGDRGPSIDTERNEQDAEELKGMEAKVRQAQARWHGRTYRFLLNSERTPYPQGEHGLEAWYDVVNLTTMQRGYLVVYVERPNNAGGPSGTIQFVEAQERHPELVESRDEYGNVYTGSVPAWETNGDDTQLKEFQTRYHYLQGCVAEEQRKEAEAKARERAHEEKLTRLMNRLQHLLSNQDPDGPAGLIPTGAQAGGTASGSALSVVAPGAAANGATWSTGVTANPTPQPDPEKEWAVD